MTYKNIALLLFSLLAFNSATADTLAINPDHPQSYTVVKGDTLWDISSKFLSEPWRWPELWKNNPQIENPHLIYPGDTLSLVYQDGQPTMQLRRGGLATYKLSPLVRTAVLDRAVPTIPIDVISPFMERAMIVGEGELDSAPYILSAQDGRVIAGAGDTVYARGMRDDDSTIDFGVFRQGPAYKSYRSNGTEVLGYEALHIGDVRLMRNGDPATLVVTSSRRELIQGDRLVALGRTGISRNFVPRLPDSDITGNIIAVVDGVSQIGQYHTVVIDRGTDDGLETGHVLGIFQSGIVVRDNYANVNQHGGEPGPLLDMVNNLADFMQLRKKQGSEEVRLPEERAGVLMVIRPYERVSYALVMETTRQIAINDSVRRP